MGKRGFSPEAVLKKISLFKGITGMGMGLNRLSDKAE
jgi:hypothetical protein